MTEMKEGYGPDQTAQAWEKEEEIQNSFLYRAVLHQEITSK